MAVLNAGFELGANGATISTAAAQADGDAWDNLTAGTGATNTLDSTRAALGAQSYKVATAGTSTQAYASWVAKLGTVTDHYGRAYFYFTALPSQTIRIVDIRNSTQTACCISILLTTGLVTASDQGVVVRGTTINAVATGQWIRIEWHAVHSTTVGALEIKLFNTATSTSATETLTVTSINTLASADRIRFGSTNNTSNHSFWIDQIQANAAAYPGVAPVGLPRGALSGVGA